VPTAEIIMRRFIIATTAATLSSSAALPQEAIQGMASIPDLSGMWAHVSCCGFEPPQSGFGPVTNRSRRDAAGDPSPSRHWWPGGVPLVIWNIGVQLIQQPDQIIIIYSNDHEVRHLQRHAQRWRLVETTPKETCLAVMVRRSANSTF
jgi:hypothetical protein